MQTATLRLLVAAALGSAAAVHAGSHTAQECHEGAGFIKNAALSRNNGQPRNVFLERLEGDLSMIRGMPVASRWFARDKADEALLIRHVERVYDQPTTPEAHERAFAAECGKLIEEGPGKLTL